MALPEKDAIVTQLFRPLSTLVNLIDVFDAAVKTMKTKTHAAAVFADRNFTYGRSNATRPQPVAHGTTGS
jgi:hypothetical protein